MINSIAIQKTRENRTRLRQRNQAAAVLLEVILGLVLFVAAATIIGWGLHASTEGVNRLRQSVHAADLATSVMSELQMGARTLSASGPEPFPSPFENWMWELHSVPLQTSASAENPGALQVQVVIRDTESDFVYRLAQIISSSGMVEERGSSPFMF